MQKVCTYHYPTTIQGRLATCTCSYLPNSDDSEVQAKKNNKIVEPARGMSSLKTSSFIIHSPQIPVIIL